MVGLKDTFKLAGISIVTCCAAFVCSLFFNYRIDLSGTDTSGFNDAAKKLYDAQMSTSTVVCAITGCCLIATSIIMLMTYIKNYVDSRSKELGIMKALGYSNLSIAKHFWVFGLSVLAGTASGWAGAQVYMPFFYDVQNKDADKYFSVARSFHVIVPVAVIAVSTAAFMLISVFFALRRVRRPVMRLIREESNSKVRLSKRNDACLPFLKELKRDTVKSRYSLIFFVGFSAFCFSAMVQMSVSMKTIASESMGIIILVIGLILAYMMILLALSAVVKGNAKTAAMMRVFGYDDKEISRSMLNGYRPIALIGFAVGTLYQYGLLKIMVNIVFKDVDEIVTYNFDVKALLITIPTFIISYELIMLVYSNRIKKLTIKSVMLEN